MLSVSIYLTCFMTQPAANGWYMGAIHVGFAGAGPTEEVCVCVGGELEGRKESRVGRGLGRGVGE